MPQMKPINWINLFILMNLIMMFMNINYYFNKNMKTLNNFNIKMLKFNYWKW